MADFEIAYGETAIFEGGYVNDPVDKGGETHLGIARKFNGDWKGWSIVDQIKAKHPNDYKARINANGKLAELAKDLFRKRYWNPIRGDEIPDQHIANKVFDTGVNMGVSRTVKFLQQGLNLLNRNQKNYSDVDIDGKLGDATLNALVQFLKLEQDKPDYLLKLLNLQQASHYVDIMKRDSTQERFARGWLNRVALS